MPAVNPSLFTTRALVRRSVAVRDDEGGRTHSERTVGHLMCRVTDAQLAPRTDQQGGLGADLARSLYCAAGSDVRAGDRVFLGSLWLRVESAGDQADGAYRKCLVTEDQAG